MAPKDIGHLAPERYEGGTGEVEGGDDPVELGDLVYVRSDNVLLVVMLSYRAVRVSLLLKSIAMKGRALATLRHACISIVQHVRYLGIETHMVTSRAWSANGINKPAMSFSR